jgi:hypothetical protein
MCRTNPNSDRPNHRLSFLSIRTYDRKKHSNSVPPLSHTEGSNHTRRVRFRVWDPSMNVRRRLAELQCLTNEIRFRHFGRVVCISQGCRMAMAAFVASVPRRQGYRVVVDGPATAQRSNTGQRS